MRDAVYAEIPVPRRQRLHQRAVDAVLGSHPTEADVIAAAGHVLEAGPAADPVDAAALVDQGWHLAAASYGFDVAVRLAEARLPLLRRYAPPAQQAAADVEVARLRLRAGRDYDRVVELLERALDTYLSLGDTEAAGLVHSRLGGTLVVPHPGMDVVRSLEHFAAAERMVPPARDPFSLHRGRFSAAMHALDTATMAASVERCAAIAEASGRPELSVVADWGRGWLALDLGRPDRGTRPPRGRVDDGPGARRPAGRLAPGQRRGADLHGLPARPDRGAVVVPARPRATPCRPAGPPARHARRPAGAGPGHHR